MAASNLWAVSGSRRYSPYTRRTPMQWVCVQETESKPWDFHRKSCTCITLVPLSLSLFSRVCTRRARQEVFTPLGLPPGFTSLLRKASPKSQKCFFFASQASCRGSSPSSNLCSCVHERTRHSQPYGGLSSKWLVSKVGEQYVDCELGCLVSSISILGGLDDVLSRPRTGCCWEPVEPGDSLLS